MSKQPLDQSDPANPRRTTQLQALDESVTLRASTASSRSERSPPDLLRKLRIQVPGGPPPGSECSPPDPICKLWIAVFAAGPPPQAPDQSVPRRISAASSGLECSPPDLTACSGSKCSSLDRHHKLRIKVFPAGPQPQAPDQSVIVFPARPQPQRISEDIAGRMPERMSADMLDTYARKKTDRMSEYMPECPENDEIGSPFCHVSENAVFLAYDS